MDEEREADEDGEGGGAERPDLDRYISPRGLARFMGERDALRREERPRIVEIVSWAAGNGDRSENGDYQYGKRRLREIDRRLRFLDHRIRAAKVVSTIAGEDGPERVRFGATVTYAGAGEHEARTVTILGVDEADLARSEVSLASPIGRALLGAGVGDEVTVQRPGGAEVIEVLAITNGDVERGTG